MCVCVRSVTQLCLTLCDPMDCSLPGSSIHGILQVRILEWVVISFSRGSSQPRDQTFISCLAGRGKHIKSCHLFQREEKRITKGIWDCVSRVLSLSGCWIAAESQNWEKSFLPQLTTSAVKPLHAQWPSSSGMPMLCPASHAGTSFVNISSISIAKHLLLFCSENQAPLTWHRTF